ncbi:hypothetical protein COW36_10025 [bacterium (Candidatus Blackallbacteria) CG17_big_fil_post_rev_8_21_14_2_50_48_46]|uniref:4Fe-4S ferredoxin-type domain-containing protein n=1 Tax=bacterium (Candidatus Blackallbacteria) CG17_big_fil_post_rev_8_21_14_2_50_48_46 TaxID=2014261 RepID=A0A2M7G5C1_9BACT|nr:MAG: hypothetical protein COW64_13870 [bacterium (Candidatus Blackallbacteria) CG18_big_fil_WC_8_21_14_2_50_49_26]PIW17136.1 MAG: hypothetical protein COW36_10025 [bacterium (Candidatus Blackallbacteria) CG17_big_fil_post_rev_8_21_14_2_50_48_46]PIW47830.1 MAG: hypothetical protein COW20_11255 [bacterium (Candidatus Blackallbacteria) CG13_big_fil_rev_8_21_14_2_50_49_14]
MKVYGTSVLKGLLYTLKTFVETYIEDFKRLSGKGQPENGLRSFSEGVVTVQYPEAPMPLGETYERFRVIPMLIYDQKEDGRDVRCTACGICAKVCPPQCIWITQQMDEKGKPITKPEEFYIDTSICMNCGLCSEFCPFDSIKMDHQFELTVTENRRENYVYDLEKLLVPAEYYASVRPRISAEEDEIRRKEEEAKKAKEEAKKAAAAAKAAAAKEAAANAPAEGSAEAAAEKPAKKVLSDEEKAALKEAALKKAAELKAKKEAEKAAAAGEAPSGNGGEPAAAAEKPAKKVLSDEEKAALKEAALKKAAELKAKKEAEKAAEQEAP